MSSLWFSLPEPGGKNGYRTHKYWAQKTGYWIQTGYRTKKIGYRPSGPAWGPGEDAVFFFGLAPDS